MSEGDADKWEKRKRRCPEGGDFLKEPLAAGGTVPPGSPDVGEEGAGLQDG